MGNCVSRAGDAAQEDGDTSGQRHLHHHLHHHHFRCTAGEDGHVVSNSSNEEFSVETDKEGSQHRKGSQHQRRYVEQEIERDGSRSSTTSRRAIKSKLESKPSKEEWEDLGQNLRSRLFLDGPEDVTRFDSITKLVASLFKCPTAVVSLTNEEKQWMRIYHSRVLSEDEEYPSTTVAQCPLPQVCDVVILHDTHQSKDGCQLEDMHLSKDINSLSKAAKDAGVRFLAAAPLVSSVHGVQYGTLLAVDAKPHPSVSKEEEILEILEQFADLVVKEIEKEKLIMLQKLLRERKPGKENKADGTASSESMSPLTSVRSSSRTSDSVMFPSLSKAVDCFQEGVMLLSGEGWDILYCNSHIENSIGISGDNLVGRGFWEFFFTDNANREEAFKYFNRKVPFTLSLELQNIYCPEAKYLTLDFRPTSARVDTDTSSTAFYFAIVRPNGAKIGDRSFGRIEQPVQSVPHVAKAVATVFQDVRLGPLIGRGAYGRVYRGTWNGNIVAVKVITSNECPCLSEEKNDKKFEENKMAKVPGIFEAALSSALSHPNVVHTYQYAVRRVRASRSLSRGSSSSSREDEVNNNDTDTFVEYKREVWLISEFCNKGPLLTAIEKGLFLTDPSATYGQPNLVGILQTLQEISAAMFYLHSHDIIHGDLTGGNVLLTQSDKDARGFTAKVVDFGLSRVCDSSLQTDKMGCAEYMPPELITGGILTSSCDVYAFGIIIWELYSGKRAWSGVKPTEVLQLVASHQGLVFPPQTPRRLKVLGEKCLAFEPSERPSFKEILAEVNSILADTMAILQQFLFSTGE